MLIYDKFTSTSQTQMDFLTDEGWHQTFVTFTTD